jgi:hypothetical protein
LSVLLAAKRGMVAARVCRSVQRVDDACRHVGAGWRDSAEMLSWRAALRHTAR